MVGSQEYLELIVHDKERHSGGLGVAAVEEGNVAALPVHLREVHQGRVQSYARAWNETQSFVAQVKINTVRKLWQWSEFLQNFTKSL